MYHSLGEDRNTEINKQCELLSSYMVPNITNCLDHTCLDKNAYYMTVVYTLALCIMTSSSIKSLENVLTALDIINV